MLMREKKASYCSPFVSMSTAQTQPSPGALLALHAHTTCSSMQHSRVRLVLPDPPPLPQLDGRSALHHRDVGTTS